MKELAGDHQSVALKYRRLGREIEALPPSDIKHDMMHTHSKLGIFISDLQDAYVRKTDAEYNPEKAVSFVKSLKEAVRIVRGGPPPV